MTGASTRSLLTACRPLRANLSAVLLAVAMPRKSGLLQRLNAGHRQREGPPRLEVHNGLVLGLQVERDHVLGADAAPGHHHDVHAVVLVVGAYHVGGHREEVGLYSKVFHS